MMGEAILRDKPKEELEPLELDGMMPYFEI